VIGDTVVEEITRKVEALVAALKDSEIGTVRRITIELQASGEHPFRVAIDEETLDVVGVASER
jgi:hypothetical protein